jgi:hypothetical protein
VYLGGGPIRAEAIADFDEDGIVDLVLAGGGSVRVLLGHGDGTFAAPAAQSVGGALRSLAVGDLDADGHLDLVAGTSAAGDISLVGSVKVLLGAGDGTFAPAVTYRSGAALALALGDLDGDDDLDVVSAERNSGEVRVFRGAGDGTLGAPQVYGGYSTAYDVALGDFDRDLDLDLAVATGGLGVAITFNDGRGVFSSTRFEPVAGSVYHVEVGLLDQDAFLDLALDSPNNGMVIALEGAGDGSFLVPGQGYAASHSGGHIASTDLDDDGDLDLAIVDTYDVLVLRNLLSR